jgi:hypothetical protein
MGALAVFTRLSTIHIWLGHPNRNSVHPIVNKSSLANRFLFLHRPQPESSFALATRHRGPFQQRKQRPDYNKRGPTIIR